MHILAMGITQRVNLNRAAERPGAAEIDVSLFLEIWNTEVAQHGNTVIVWVIIVPLKALGVDEQHDVGEVLVIVDDVSAMEPWSMRSPQYLSPYNNPTHVKYTIDSRPLFRATVKEACLSSTT